MDEEILVARGEDEAAAELEGVFAQPVLAVTTALGPSPGPEVVAPHQVEKAGRTQAHGTVGDAVGVYQEGKADTGLFAEGLGVVAAPETDRRDLGSGVSKLLLMVAQLRDVLAAEDSTVVAQEHDHGGALVPEVAEAARIPVGIR